MNILKILLSIFFSFASKVPSLFKTSIKVLSSSSVIKGAFLGAIFDSILLIPLESKVKMKTIGNKIFFITPLKKNLNYDTLKDRFVKDNKESLFEIKIVQPLSKRYN